MCDLFLSSYIDFCALLSDPLVLIILLCKCYTLIFRCHVLLLYAWFNNWLDQFWLCWTLVSDLLLRNGLSW